MQISPYHVWWTFLVPVRGKATIKDRDIRDVHGLSRMGKILFFFSKDKMAAHEKIKKMQGKLSKTFKVYGCSDKQFGLSDRSRGTEDNPFGIKFTEKQIAESFLIS